MVMVHNKQSKHRPIVDGCRSNLKFCIVFNFVSKRCLSACACSDSDWFVVHYFTSVGDPDAVVSEDLTDELPLAGADVAADDLAVPDEDESGHLHDLHGPEELHAAVVLVAVHAREDGVVDHGPRQLQHGGVHLDAGPAVLEAHVQHDELALVAAVLVDERLHVLPRVQLHHRRVAVAVVEDVAREPLGADGLLLVHLLGALVEVEVGHLRDALPAEQLLGGLRLVVAQDQQEVHVAAGAAELHHGRVDLAAVLAVARRELHHHQPVLGGLERVVELLGAVHPDHALVLARRRLLGARQRRPRRGQHRRAPPAADLRLRGQEPDDLGEGRHGAAQAIGCRGPAGEGGQEGGGGGHLAGVLSLMLSAEDQRTREGRRKRGIGDGRG
jgi:hypothetical protein